MNRWQQMTARANTEFSLQFYGNAIVLHNQALESARYKFTENVGKTDEIDKVMISYFNLADCYIAIDEIDRACDFYLWAQDFLLGIGQGHCDSSKVLKVVKHALSHSHSIWIEFLKKHRDQIAYDKLLKYHHSSLSFNDIDVKSYVCH